MTTRCSASGVRSRCSDVTPRRASLWPWPRACSPAGVITGSTGIAPAPPPPVRRGQNARSYGPDTRSPGDGPGATLRPQLSRRALPGGSTRKWALARFFYDSTTEEIVSSLGNQIEQRLATAEPGVEVLLVEVVSD